MAAGLAAGTVFLVAFSFLSLPSFQNPPSDQNNSVSTVTIPYGASIETNSPSYDPAIIKVKIGMNNTVRWINQDSVPHGVTSDDGRSLT